MSKKKKMALFLILLGIFLPSLSILSMQDSQDSQDSIETSIRQHEFVLVEGSAQVTVSEGALAGKTFTRQQGRISIPYAYIFGAGATSIFIGGLVYLWSLRQGKQIPQYKYYRD
jgi:hypothetical protein